MCTKNNLNHMLEAQNKNGKQAGIYQPVVALQQTISQFQLSGSIKHLPQLFDSSQVNSTLDLIQQARGRFIRKVYSILAFQLFITVGLVTFSTLNADFRHFQQTNLLVYLISFLVSLASILVLALVKGIANRSPVNIILLGIFTISKAYLVSTTSSYFSADKVLFAGIATLAATLFLTAYAITTKTDFSDQYSKWLGFIWSTFGAGVCLAVLNYLFISSGLWTFFIGLAVGSIFSVYLIIDTQLIMGARNQELSLDSHILGATLLYLDIINMFLYILSMFGGGQ